MTRIRLRALAGSSISCLLWMAAALGAAPWLPELTDHAVQAGADAKLPPILSVVLGVSAREQPTPVRQLVARDDRKVHTFNVCATDHAKIVLMATDEQTGAATAFLVSPKGTLRKAVSYVAGQPAEVLSAEAARPALGKELDYWSRQPRR